MTEHRIAYLLKHSRIIAALEHALVASPLTHEQRLAPRAAYERLYRRLLEGQAPNWHWLVLILEAAGLHDVRVETNGEVTANTDAGHKVTLPSAA